MITEAILSFIGAGTPPNIPSWGNIMAEGRSLFQIACYIDPVPGHLPVADRARGQPARRRAARRARPAPRAADVTHADGATLADRPATTAPLLAVDDLRTHFFTRDGVVRAVDGVSFTCAPARRWRVVGESGCGKSVTALSILRLIAVAARAASSAARSASQGRDLLDAQRRARCARSAATRSR